MRKDGFPEKIYGRCPLGHNMAPSEATGNTYSTNLIEEGEESLLHWSDYWQRYICIFHIRRVEDEIHEDVFHERDLELERKRQGMGIVKSSDYSVTEP